MQSAKLKVTCEAAHIIPDLVFNMKFALQTALDLGACFTYHPENKGEHNE